MNQDLPPLVTGRRIHACGVYDTVDGGQVFHIVIMVVRLLVAIFIGPESDHWLSLSLTNSLTN